MSAIILLLWWLLVLWSRLLILLCRLLVLLLWLRLLILSLLLSAVLLVRPVNEFYPVRDNIGRIYRVAVLVLVAPCLDSALYQDS